MIRLETAGLAVTVRSRHRPRPNEAAINRRTIATLLPFMCVSPETARRQPHPRAVSQLADDVVRPHHLVVFVLQNVAVPDVPESLPRSDRRAGRQIELRDHLRHHTRISDDGILA